MLEGVAEILVLADIVETWDVVVLQTLRRLFSPEAGTGIDFFSGSFTGTGEGARSGESEGSKMVLAFWKDALMRIIAHDSGDSYIYLYSTRSNDDVLFGFNLSPSPSCLRVDRITYLLLAVIL